MSQGETKDTPSEWILNFLMIFQNWSQVAIVCTRYLARPPKGERTEFRPGVHWNSPVLNIGKCRGSICKYWEETFYLSSGQTCVRQVFPTSSSMSDHVTAVHDKLKLKHTIEREASLRIHKVKRLNSRV